MVGSEYLVINGIIISWGNPNQILDGHAMYIRDGVIADIARQDVLTKRFPDLQCLDAQGQFVMPGLICAHTHFYGAFSRGLAIPGKPAKDFPEILKKLWWPLDLALDDEAIRLSTFVCLIDAVKHGTTTLIDHHASPNRIAGSLDIIADTVRAVGERAVLCYEVTDRNGIEGAKAGIQENVRFIKKVNANYAEYAQVSTMFGLHASLTLSEQTLDACREEAPEGIGFHIHAAEHKIDELNSLKKYGVRVVDRLNRHNLLGINTLLVHGVHLDPHEISLVAETGTWLTHQPRSNMNNGVGLPAIEKMLDAGVKVCLGNDGFSNTMWEEWKTAYLAHKLWKRDPRRMDASKVIAMGVYNNAHLVSRLFRTPIGVLEKNAQADLIFVDYHPYTGLYVENLPWHIIFGFHESMITTTIVAGKVLMHNRTLTTVDEGEICSKAREIAPRIWSKYNEHQKEYL